MTKRRLAGCQRNATGERGYLGTSSCARAGWSDIVVVRELRFFFIIAGRQAKAFRSYTQVVQAEKPIIQ